MNGVAIRNTAIRNAVGPKRNSAYVDDISKSYFLRNTKRYFQYLEHLIENLFCLPLVPSRPLIFTLIILFDLKKYFSLENLRVNLHSEYSHLDFI
jgi:hypothetical protein